MCCAFLTLVLLGPRFFGAIWWIWQPVRWESAFNNWAGGSLWWIWPVLGIIFLPWTTIMYVICAPGGLTGFDWLWIGLAVAADVVSYGGGVGRRRIPQYQGY
jgi:hypothetical protein